MRKLPNPEPYLLAAISILRELSEADSQAEKVGILAMHIYDLSHGKRHHKIKEK